MIASTLAATPLPEILLRRRALKHVTVLGYHRVMPLPGPEYPFNEGMVSVTPEEFARELKYFRANLDVISMSQLLDGLRDPSRLPPRPAVITFDDGYRDNFNYALPLLNEAGLPACFFVCTGLVGTRAIPWYEAWVCCLKQSRARRIESPFDGDDAPYDLGPEHWPASFRRFRQRIRNVPWRQMPAQLERLRELTSVNPDDLLSDPLFMSWDEVRGLASAGMDIGGHTRTHPILSRVEDPVTLRDEIGGCHGDLAIALGRPPFAFAYPWGHTQAMSADADAEIARAGFQLSFSYMDGFAPRQVRKAARLPRLHTDFGDNHHAFRLRMATAPDLSSLAG
ncbi:MAG TPA: polysaccharide deacetylase family protein [Tepidisphaeraceae bacterium]